MNDPIPFQLLQKTHKFAWKSIIKNELFRALRSQRRHYCYERSFEGEKIMVICNFKNAEIPFTLPSDTAYVSAELALHNYGYDRKLEIMTLRPYESMVFHIK